MQTRYRVLLVEDDDGLRKVYALWLRSEGYTVAACESAEAALAAAEQNPPDVVLSDVGLPGRDGVELARVMKGRFSVPVFLMSARLEPPIHDAEGFFSKPLDFEEVSRALRDACALCPRRRVFVP